MKRRRTSKNTQKRSSLSFNDGNASLDVDDVLRSNPWKDINKFEQSDAGRIQRALNEANETFAKQQTGNERFCTVK